MGRCGTPARGPLVTRVRLAVTAQMPIVRECVGRDSNVRHFTRDSLFTLCGRLLGTPARDGAFERCIECDYALPYARRGWWADFASVPGFVLVHGARRG